MKSEMTDPFEVITKLLKDDLVSAHANIMETKHLADKFGVDLDLAVSARSRPKTYVSGSKGKSKPQLDQWLARALDDDGLLPKPTEHLIISNRMVRQALEQGLIEGNAHPYRITSAGKHFAKQKYK